MNKFLYKNKIYLSFYSLEQNLNPQIYSVLEVNNIRHTFLRVINNMIKVFENFLTLTNITSDIDLVNEQNNYTQIYSNEINLRDISYFNYVDKSQPIIFGSFIVQSNRKVNYVESNI